MKIYHFDLGNSTKGPIGFCADVRAKSKAEAVKILRSHIETMEDGLNADECSPDEIEYCNVYFNAGAVSEANIEDERDA